MGRAQGRGCHHPLLVDAPVLGLLGAEENMKDNNKS